MRQQGLMKSTITHQFNFTGSVASVETVLYFLHSSVFLSMSRPLFTKQMFYYYIKATTFNAKIHTGQPVMYFTTLLITITGPLLFTCHNSFFEKLAD